MVNRKSVNVYDFDKTIYNGDASFDFILFNYLRSPKLFRYAPAVVFAIIGYIFGFQDRKGLKQSAFSFLKGVEDIDTVLDVFWEKHSYKMTDWYTKCSKKSDIVISASPEFLLAPIAKKIDVTLIATRMDERTGRIYGNNCRAEEKVARLEEHDRDRRLDINKAYSDSLSDLPLLQLAGESFIVRREKIIPLEAYKPSRIDSFTSRTFLRFLFVGGINALLGVVLSFLASLLYNPVLAFVMGYSLSLVISYFLNSIIAFRNTEFSIRQFIRFVISYIPNFLIQFILVYVLTQSLGILPLVAYVVAVVIAVPITFILLSKHTFKEVSRE